MDVDGRTGGRGEDMVSSLLFFVRQRPASEAGKGEMVERWWWWWAGGGQTDEKSRPGAACLVAANPRPGRSHASTDVLLLPLSLHQMEVAVGEEGGVGGWGVLWPDLCRRSGKDASLCFVGPSRFRRSSCGAQAAAGMSRAAFRLLGSRSWEGAAMKGF